VTAAFRTAGVTGGPPKPAILASPSAYCATLCHSRVMPSDKVFFREMELQFPHALHVRTWNRVREVPLPREAQDAHRDEVRVHEVPPREQGHRLRALPQGAAGLYEGKVKAYGVTPAPDVMAAADTKCIECHDLKKGRRRC